MLPAGAWSDRLPVGAGAPKFLKNWLTFAHSPYDPDHKRALGGPPDPPDRGSFNGTHFPPVARKLGNHFKNSY
jgi:hypothetical protein